MTEQTGRPLSPHLQVYKPQLTSVMSILHRFTGFALTVGCFMVTWMLVAAALGPEAYEIFKWFNGTWLGILMLCGWSFSFYYHLCNGIRHLCWDMGYLFKIEEAYLSGYIVLISSVVLTFVTWWFVCPVVQGN